MSVPIRKDDAKTTVVTLQQKKERGERIAMLTAYDFPTARILDGAEIDALLVGDSLAMVVLGHDTTLSVTMDEMLHHARAVARAARRSLLIADMPFLSYQADTAEAVRNAGRFLKEAGMDAVKLEGGRDYADTVRAIVRAGIPVMGHLGLLPQSVHKLGGYRTQARTAGDAAALLDDALALEAAGCFAIVLESVPAKVAAVVTDRLRIPTIGIGAGNGTERPGARAARPARPLRADAAFRPTLRAALRGDRAGRDGLPRRRRLGCLPGTRGVVHDRRPRVGRVPRDDRGEAPAADRTLTQESTPILIAGTGAMACVLGARLARAGAAVTLAGSWREALDAIAARGLRVHEPDETWSVRVAAVPIDRLTATFPLALVLVKSHQTAAVADVLERALERSGLAVTLQNGLGNAEALGARLGVERVAAGIAVMGATLVAPGEVRHVPGRVVLGSSPATAERVERLATLLRAAGIPTAIADDIAAAVWCKLAANCAVNPLTALFGLTNGALLEREDLRAQLVAAAREVAAVAAAKGIRLERDAVLSTLETARATAANRSSMLQDLERGARTEIDAMCGAVVREGRRLGIATPVNADCFRRVREREGRPLAREDEA